MAPTADVPILLERLVDGEPVRQLHIARWGLVPSWAKDPGIGSKMINARSESVLEKPAFRKATRSRRCAVPADGYYEWKGEGPQASSPTTCTRRTAGPLSSPGSMSGGRTRPRPTGDPERWMLSTSIMTTDSPPEGYAGGMLAELTALHDRVPLPMDRATMQAWLDPHADDAAALVGLVRAGAHDVAEGWTIDAVGTAVGNVKNDSPELIQPVGSLF